MKLENVDSSRSRGATAREPGVRLAAAGVSLGGNVLLKWLGEHGVDVPEPLVGAAAISVPYNLAPCAEALDQQGYRVTRITPGAGN